MMWKTKKKEEFDERQMHYRYKYGLHCYVITLFLLFSNTIVKTFLKIDFENEFDFFLLILGISASYYVFRLVVECALLPQQWRNKTGIITFMMFVVNILGVFRWMRVTHIYQCDFGEKIIDSDFIESFVLQFISMAMLISFLIRCVRERRDEKEE